MSFSVTPLTILSSDKIHTLKGKVYLPSGEIKGIFHLVHGMNEYIGRYEHLFAALCEEGFICAGFDNLGHGETALCDNSFGFIASKDGFKRMVEDVALFSNALKENYPEKPIYLMGHSMGSFIARLTAAEYPDLYEKCIFCGTAGKNPLAKPGLLLTKTIAKIKGERHVSEFCLNIAFGSYNKKFSGDSNFEWVTSDREILEKYENDPFCNFKFSVSALHDLVTLIDRCNKKSWYKSFPKNTPTFIISGDMDPVGNYGNGVRKVYNELAKNSCNVKLKLYPDARHEIHNDFCKNQVISDIQGFLKGVS